MKQTYPILEYDPERHAIIDIDLENDALPNMPEHCVICFFRDVFERFLEQELITPLTTISTEMGEHPVYLYSVGGHQVALLHQGMGAPLAAFLLEELIAMGGRKFIACGGAGVLDQTIAMGHLLVPTAAIRDEGTSYHYLPPSREIEPTVAALAAIEATLKRRNAAYLYLRHGQPTAFFAKRRAKWPCASQRDVWL
ncbi:MAG: nucleoside phosphorylase [Chloroflexota bacterium]